MFKAAPSIAQRQDQVISRTSLAWLLIIQIFILAPHFISVPVWIAIVWIGIAFWRWKIFQGAWNYPGKLQKTLLVLGCCLGLYLSLGKGFRFELMVSLLIVGFTLKLLELKNRTDFVLLIFISLFILATQFIQFNHFLAALYGFFCLTLLCATLMQLYIRVEQQSIWRSIRPALNILLQAIPFMLILFVVMPRLGSFWAVPSPQQAKTGMSDSMSPGDFSELMESDEVAFRVKFLNNLPAREKLYWRSLVFSDFDGRRWSQSREQKFENEFNQASKKLRSHIAYEGNEVEYDVIAEASRQPWLYALAAPKSWSSNLAFARDMRLQAFGPVNERMSYHVVSALNYQFNEIRSEELMQNTVLPKSGNPKTRERARAWLAEAGSTEKFIEKVLAYYQQSFFYTLKPPPLGMDVVDEFLWDTRQGFCEHFASSFVFFIRAAGIPARVVVGYQGGDINSVDGSLTVRQRDAHAWSEVWLEGRGWVMFDPTASVAPQRIQQGIEQSLSETDRQFLAKPFGSSIKFLLHLRERWDAVNLNWTRWVLNFDSDTQSSLLKKWMGDSSVMRTFILMMTLIAGLCALLFVLLVLENPKAELSESARIYLTMCKKLKPLGFVPRPGETPRQFIIRVISSRPELSSRLYSLIDLYERSAYGEEAGVLHALNTSVATFRPKR
jgi:transglutaminase-like putative cysteine protease